MQPLNPTLFKLLELRFGSVDVVAQGQGIVWSLADRPITASRRENSRPGRRVIHSGEEYKVSCPFCGDSRKRLYVNHRWGVFDKETLSLNLFLAQCFNEQCMDGRDRQIQLHEQVFAPAPDKRGGGRMEVAEGRQGPIGIAEVRPPGPVVRMDEMVKKYPSHDAVKFLEDKFYDPVKLGRVYNVGFCPQSRYSLAQNRILIPMYHEGKLVGWQARYIGEPPNRSVPKFWSCPGMARRLLAYNFDVAVKHQTVVIVEGPGDVWGFGPQAMAVLGKTMNPALQRRFVTGMKAHGRGQVVVVILDPEQDPLEKEKGKPHHIDKLVDQLRPALGLNVFGIYLPMGTDPGDMERSWTRALIRREAKKRKLHVSFAKRKVA